MHKLERDIVGHTTYELTFYYMSIIVVSNDRRSMLQSTIHRVTTDF